MTEKWEWSKGDEPTHAELHPKGLSVGEASSVLYHGADWPMSKEHKAIIAAAPETKKQRDDLLDACVKAHDALLALHVCDQDKSFADETRAFLRKTIKQAEKD